MLSVGRNVTKIIGTKCNLFQPKYKLSTLSRIVELEDKIKTIENIKHHLNDDLKSNVDHIIRLGKYIQIYNDRHIFNNRIDREELWTIYYWWCKNITHQQQFRHDLLIIDGLLKDIHDIANIHYKSPFNVQLYQQS